MLDHLLESNRQWAAEVLDDDPEFFQRQALGQQPQYLWMGCSDSRVASNQLLGLSPGDLFVHRNIANLVDPTDLSSLAVLQFAIGVLHVEHVIVCGHYGCGGVQAAMEGGTSGPIDDWLAPLRKLSNEYRNELDRYSAEVDRLELLCELNVLHQVNNIAGSFPVQEAWAHGQKVHVHGWVYDIGCGRIFDLNSTTTGTSDAVDTIETAVARRVARRRNGR